MDKIDIHVIAAKRIFRKPVNADCKDIPDDFIKNNVHYVSESKDAFLYNASFQRGIFRELPKLNKEYHFDVMHTHHAHMGDLLYKLKSQIPSVVTVHTTIKGQIESILRASKLKFNEMDESERYQILLSGFLLSTERLYFKRCQNVTTVSDWMKTELINSFHMKNVDVIYSGVEPDVFRPTKNSSILPEIKAPIVLFTSSMGPRKGSFVLVNAIKQVLEKNKNVHFMFAGSTSPQIGEILRSNLVDNRYFTVLGYLSYEQLPDLYARASIFVSPSLCDNLPARILEAMSCEVPVIATSIAAVPEAIEDEKTGLLVQPGDVDALANAILRLLDDGSLRRNLGKDARQKVLKKFSWDKLAEQTKCVYERVAC
jgi:glycosyltransferase involved in cell wall biosynthesis